MGTFSAALAYEDFDPSTPEIGYKVLLRLIRLRSSDSPRRSPRAILPAALQVGTTKDGHEWSGWKVDALSW
jgi:hypothetical protein